jgi:transposase-like protein
MGIWGLSSPYIYEHGKTMPWFAGEGFRSYLLLMEDLKNRGILRIDDDYKDRRFTGWWSGNMTDFFSRNELSEVLRQNSRIRLLLTPPEIGPGGQQGIPAQNRLCPVSGAQKGFVINANVTDDTLAKILEIFDAITFEPDLFVLTHYGIEGECFYWSGPPFESQIVSIPGSREPHRYMASIITPRDMLPFTFPSESMKQLASGNQGQAMQPQAFDYNAVSPDVRNAFEDMLKTASDFWSSSQSVKCGILLKKRKRMITMTMTPVRCPNCKGTAISKNGTEKGKQRYICNNTNCGMKSFMLEYTYNGCEPGIDEIIITMTANSSGISDISRVLEISEGKVSRVLKKQ